VLNVTIHQDGIEKIENAIEKCDEESCKNQLLFLINKATERAAMYTGQPRTSILRIRRKHKQRNANNLTQLFKSPGKKKQIRSYNIVLMDAFDMCVIRNTIQDFYIQKTRVPTIP
jgi:isocitrate/isopropylmalate dehydrogenase